MDAAKTKTARFAMVVKECGAPQTATLWLNPEKDPAFKKAVREGRIMTLVRHNLGAKRDFGLAGFQQRPGATYLIFPKPLRQFADRKIVGIDYDLIQEPEVKTPATVKRAMPRAKPRKVPVTRRYAVKLRFVGIITREVEVEARDRAEAEEKAVRETTPDWGRRMCVGRWCG